MNDCPNCRPYHDEPNCICPKEGESITLYRVIVATDKPKLVAVALQRTSKMLLVGPSEDDRRNMSYRTRFKLNDARDKHILRSMYVRSSPEAALHAYEVSLRETVKRKKSEVKYAEEACAEFADKFQQLLIEFKQRTKS